jgi:hypothetical protein
VGSLTLDPSLEADATLAGLAPHETDTGFGAYSVLQVDRTVVITSRRDRRT